jgi:adenine phosphoribosyltransferase
MTPANPRLSSPTTSPHLTDRLRAAIRDVPDFPKPGILFKDITPILADGDLFRAATEAITARWEGAAITHVAGIESRGFIVGAPVAQALGAGFLPIRKPGKLPSRRERVDYALEYGTDALEIHADACGREARVLVVDDVLATGGTAAAAAALVARLGADLAGFGFLVELTFLGGAARLDAGRHTAVLTY